MNITEKVNNMRSTEITDQQVSVRVSIYITERN